MMEGDAVGIIPSLLESMELIVLDLVECPEGFIVRDVAFHAEVGMGAGTVGGAEHRRVKVRTKRTT